jgi:threonylcarbamoyladenosine tRNA methylthiotransferase MtaB
MAELMAEGHVKYAVVTFGCRVNQADSLGFEEELLAAGARVASPESADLVVVNTCSVTATADQGARQTIRRIARDNPSVRIVVTGCYATRRPDEVAALPNVVRVVPNDEKPHLVQLLKRSRAENAEIAELVFFANPASLANLPNPDGPCGAAIEPGVAGRTAFTLRVQTGCAEPCAYCIIPATRGAPRSAPIATLLGEIERVTAAGFKEIALTGVHMGSYGRDLDTGTSLIDLLRAIESFVLSSSGRAASVLFRISSLEPMDCTREIVELVASSPCFAPHFHLPLQHASNRILAAMRRPYTLEYYESLADHIRARLPGASIGSDVIVGFPGETDDDFDRLAAYLNRSPLTHIHVFPYSDRPGTVATALRDKVPGAVIRDRARRVREVGHRLSERFRDLQVGTTHRALTLEDGSLAVTGNYLKVRIPPGRARNEWVRVRLTSRNHSHLDGELLGG